MQGLLAEVCRNYSNQGGVAQGRRERGRLLRVSAQQL